jgi:serine/threonine protein kinase
MGEVYRARDGRLHRDVAIKVLPAALAADPGRRARLETEARVLAALNHPNIAAVYGIEEGAGVLGIVLELVEGETLADRIARGALPAGEALAMAGQLIDALEAAHDRGIVHRDLKPANIRIAPGGTLKVLDFGLARATAADYAVTATVTAAGVVVGTAAYVSPEQARGHAVDKRTDIWAFGCVLCSRC